MNPGIEQLKPIAERTPRPPFTGLLPRLAAFIIDMMLIYFVGYTLEMTARDPLLALGPWLPFGSHVAAFAYFWLGNGPVGGGATLGKAVLNLHVVGADGRPLDLASSLRRAVLQYPFIYAPGLFVFLVRVLDLPFAVSFYVGDPLRSLCYALLAAMAYGVALHPLRRGWHDLWVDSYVTPDPTPSSFGEALASEKDEAFALRLKVHGRANLFLVIVIAAALIGLWVLPLADARSRRDIALVTEFAREDWVEGYRMKVLTVLPTADWETLRALQTGALDPAAIDDAASSDPLALAAVGPAGQTIRFHFVKSRGHVAADDFDGPELRGQVESLRGAARRAHDSLSADSDAPSTAPLHLAALFADRFEFVLFSPGKTRLWIVDGPADPDAGPLRYEWIDESEQPATEEPTPRRPPSARSR